MLDIGTKVENDGATTAGQLSSDEFNNHNKELENAVKRSSQTLTGVGTFAELQLAMALTISGCSSQSYIGAGTANAQQITPVTGSLGVVIPNSYTLMGGYKASYYAGLSNTGATTLNIGQTAGTLLGAKKVLTRAGAELSVGAISIGRKVEVCYDLSADGGSGAWIIAENSIFEELSITTVETQAEFDAVFDGSLLTNRTIFLRRTDVLSNFLLNNDIPAGKNLSIYSDGAIVNRNGDVGFTAIGTVSVWLENVHFWGWTFDGQGGLGAFGGSTTYSGSGGFVAMRYIRNSSFKNIVRNSKVSGSGGAYSSNTGDTENITIENVEWCEAGGNGGGITSLSNSKISNINNCTGVQGGGCYLCNDCEIKNISYCIAVGNGGGCRSCDGSNISNIYNCDAQVGGGGCYACDNATIDNVRNCTAPNGGGCGVCDNSTINNVNNCDATTLGGGCFLCSNCTISNIKTCTALQGGGISSCTGGSASNIDLCVATSAVSGEGGGGCYLCTNMKIDSVSNCDAKTGGGCNGCAECSITNIASCTSSDLTGAGSNGGGGGCFGCINCDINTVTDCTTVDGRGGGCSACDNSIIKNVNSCTAEAGGGCAYCDECEISNINECSATVSDGGGAYTCSRSVFLGSWVNNTSVLTYDNIAATSDAIAFCLDSFFTEKIQTVKGNLNW